MAIQKSIPTTDDYFRDTLPDWAHLLKLNWPRTTWLQEPDFTFSMRHMLKVVKKEPSEDELMEVVEWMSGPDSRQKYAPTLREFIINIFMYRKIKYAEQNPDANSDSQFLSNVKQGMRNAKSWTERWDTMIQPSKYIGLPRDSTTEECIELDRWAKDQWPQWEEATHKIKQTMAEGIRNARTRMFNGNIKNEARAYYMEKVA